MATVTVLAHLSRGAGTYESPAVVFPIGDNRISLSCDRTSLTSLSRGTDVLRIEFDISQDDELNWSRLFSFTTDGGEIIGNGGAVVSRSGIADIYVPGVGNTDRKVRARLVVMTALSTSVRVDTSSGPEPDPHEPQNSVAFAQCSSAQGTAVTGLTQSLTIAADTNRLLLSFIGVNDNEAGLGTPSVVWNTSETLTDISPASNWPYVTAAFNDEGLEVRRRIAPTATTADLVFSGMISGNRIFFGWAVAYGVDQTTPVGTTTLNFGTTGNTATGSCTGVTDGLAFAVCFHSRSASPTITDDGSQAGRTEQEGIGGRCAGSIATLAGSGTLNFSWTLGGSGTTDAWGVVAIPLSPSSSTAAGPFVNAQRLKSKLMGLVS